jgi:hypothetical protein
MLLYADYFLEITLIEVSSPADATNSPQRQASLS